MIIKKEAFYPCEYGDKTCPYKAKTQEDCHKICRCIIDREKERNKGNAE